MDHVKEAERLLADADKYGTDPKYMQRALAHALLALTEVLTKDRKDGK